ncbi:hypothetical protein RchiOBHm_Chr5g0038951 [Rosa chinensis]|uniref:Uncharacterized protein n=1 Tax=Rosa chinensis TaxID=74649 RepID=A0A2P6QC60_ROSCH|nr:hypothetical protein RchiOBHm_Chr5g0038951 [Rosa chinensis]
MLSLTPSPLLQPSPTCLYVDYMFELTLEYLNIDSWLSANLGVMKGLAKVKCGGI